MRSSDERGFSLIELMIVIVVLGLVLSFSVPAFHGFSASLQLQGAADDVAAQLRLAREKALATGVVQPVSFRYNYLGASDYCTMPATGSGGSWRLPKGITYAWGTGTDSLYTFQTDGRCDKSGLIVLRNAQGVKDTVSVQLSGLVLTQ